MPQKLKNIAIIRKTGLVLKIITKITKALWKKKINISSTIDVLLDKKLIVYWSHGPKTKNNFGDAINPFLLQKLIHKEPVHSSTVLNLFFRPQLYFIGSILDNLCTFNAIVMGSGFKKEKAKVLIKPKRVFAVRGPLTRKKFLEYGVECPEVYCDPALLLPEFIPNKQDSKIYDVGIVAHYIDKKILNDLEIKGEYQIKILNIEDDPYKFIDELTQCKTIFSSSLHGIIVAHAYNIPATWTKLSDNLIGKDFKFRDYYASVGEDEIICYEVEHELDVEKGISLSKTYNTQKNTDSLKKALKEFTASYIS